MAQRINTLEMENAVIDLTTDESNGVILRKKALNPADSNDNDSVINLTGSNDTDDDDDVKFIGKCVKFVPVITISDSDILEDKCNKADTKPPKYYEHDTSPSSGVISNPNKCSLNRTATCKLEINSTVTFEDCGNLKRKACSVDNVQSQQIKIMETDEKAHTWERKPVAETAALYFEQKYHNTDSKCNVQVQNTKNESVTEGEYPKNEICKRKIKNEHDEEDSNAHPRKPKIKVRVIVKKPGLEINSTQPKDKLVKQNPPDHVTSKDTQDGCSKTGNQDCDTKIQTQRNRNVVKKWLASYKNSRSNKISNQVATTDKKAVTEPNTGKETLCNIVSKLRSIMESSSCNQTEGNGESKKIKVISEICKETSNEDMKQNTIECSQLEKSTVKLPAHIAGGIREGGYGKKIVEALPQLPSINDNQKDSKSKVQLLPVKMTITECDNQVVYAVPLLRLPIQKQIIYFSPEYIELFLKKVRDVFDVEKFLRAIPDPFSYFRQETNNQYKYRDQCLALMYLKSKYRKVPFPDIVFTFERNRCSITLTCDKLDVWKSPWKSSSRKIGVGCGCPKPHELSMPFIHEVTFIENKRLIEHHLKSKTKKKAASFEIAKLRGELHKCGHCGVSDLLDEDMAPCTVLHLFCKICVQNAVDTRLRACENPFSCLRKECQWLFSMEILKKAVKPVTFSCLLHIRHLKEMEMAGVKLLETCPYCGFADIPSRDDQVFCCLNPDCMRETCRQCKGQNHSPHPCGMAVRSHLEMPLTATKRSVQYQNQSQSKEMVKKRGNVRQPNSLLQQPRSLTQYPQQQTFMQHPQAPSMHQPWQSYRHQQLQWYEDTY